MKDNVKDLNLLLLYLSGWEEDSRNTPGEKIFRSWNGYLFEVLNQLEEEDLIHQYRKGKSVIITPEGLEKARELEKKFL